MIMIISIGLSMLNSNAIAYLLPIWIIEAYLYKR